MGEELGVSCARPTSGAAEKDSLETGEKEPRAAKEVKNMIMIGRKAPDFTAPAYHKGKFLSIKLSDYAGKWVVLCFYPGDFTFV